MNALFLSGESLPNKQWIEQVMSKLQPLFGKTKLHSYRHWEQGVKDLGDYIIFAKSAGAVLSMQGIARGALDPQYCVFVGVPLPFAKRSEDAVATWAHNYHKGSLFIQNDHDPLTSAEELGGYLQTLDLENYELCTLPGDSHSYPDLTKLLQLTQDHLK
jgi:hypothetical protein